MLCAVVHTCVNVTRWYDGAILAQGVTSLTLILLFFSKPSGGERGGVEMSEKGMRGFAAFALEQNLTGISEDKSPSWRSNFKKSAPLPARDEEKDREVGHRLTGLVREDDPGRSRRRRREEHPDETRPRESRRRHSGRGDGGHPGEHSPGVRRRRRREEPAEVNEDKREVRRSRTRGVSLRPGEDLPRSSTAERKKAPGQLPEEAFHPALIKPEVPSQAWRKKAPRREFEADSSRSRSPEVIGRGDLGQGFEKKAQFPVFPVKSEPELRLRPVRPVAGATASGSKDKEDASMRAFDERCLLLYTDLLGNDQEMEITQMLSGIPEGDWASAFADLTRPKRAATGMVYIRMMEDYMRWYKEQKEDAAGGGLPPSCKDVFWLYLHHVKTSRTGKYSPKAAHLALRYFADCFGFSDEAVTYRRVRRLVENCSKLEAPRNQAEMIPVATLDYLESAVGDHTLPLGVRLAAGKLRLCVQSSLRWDDLSRTPFGNVEWVRRKGSASIIGLRSKDAQSKTGVRPWVSSYLGVTQHSDDWLAILVQMLLDAHGAGWQYHDHTGKSFSPDGKTAKTTVASFNQDVTFVRALLVEAVDAGLEIGLSKEQASGLRWHGAKATLTSFMMHCKVSPRAVRFAGNWKDQRETMPDTYLREAQLLVLEAQEQVLKYIRGGGYVATLEGIPLGPGVDLGRKEAESSEYQKALEDIARVSEQGPQPAGLEARDVAEAILDDATCHGGERLNEQLADEQNLIVETKEIEELIEAVTEEKPAEEPWREDADGENSSDEFYDSCYLQVPQNIRGSFHRPSGVELGLPRCGTKARSFVPVSVEEKLGKKASFCVKCFGKMKAGGCDKTCSHTKVVLVGEQEVLVRCVRRCERTCERLAGYLDVDERDHRCSIHEEGGEVSDEEEETEGTVEKKGDAVDDGGSKS